MTRAMERLYLTRAKKRSVYGKLLSRSPSPFLADIENHLKKYLEALNASPLHQAAKDPAEDLTPIINLVEKIIDLYGSI